jgi:hypothetical protein
MNRRPDIDRVLQVWMADGPAAIPDRVVDVVAARIGVQRQRRTWPFPGRTNVTTQVKLIAGLAAALLVAVVGWQLLPDTTDPGATPPAPTPSAQSTSAATAVPTAAARYPAWYPPAAVADANGAGILTAGSHKTRVFRPGFTFTAPDGWVNAYDEPNYFTLFPDTPANQAEFERSEAFVHEIVIGPHASPYFFCESLENNTGPGAARMAAAVVANEALATTGVVDVEIGGLTGKQLDVRLNPEWTGTCPGDPPGLNLADQRTRGILLDAPNGGVLVFFLGSLQAADHEAFLAEAMPIIESFEFDLGQ